jgi:hypothetical protein
MSFCFGDIHAVFGMYLLNKCNARSFFKF